MRSKQKSEPGVDLAVDVFAYLCQKGRDQPQEVWDILYSNLLRAIACVWATDNAARCIAVLGEALEGARAEAECKKKLQKRA